MEKKLDITVWRALYLQTTSNEQRESLSDIIYGKNGDATNAAPSYIIQSSSSNCDSSSTREVQNTTEATATLENS